MYKPPFSSSSFKAPKADPMQPLSARVSPKPMPGQRVHEAPVIRKPGHTQPNPRVQLIDPRKIRERQSDVDRKKDLVKTPMVNMSEQSDTDNLTFMKEMEEAKMAEFWVFPAECTDVFMHKPTGLAYPNVCIIGINGKQYPLFPGNNRAPSFVYEALEDLRELRSRYKEKIAPPKSAGRSISFSDPRSSASRTRANMITNPNIFNDSMLGRPNAYDSSQDATAAHLIRQHREQALKNK